MIPTKIYEVIPDEKAEQDDFVRVIDESGEDYLFHQSHFDSKTGDEKVQHKSIKANQRITIKWSKSGSPGGRGFGWQGPRSRVKSRRRSNMSEY